MITAPPQSTLASRTDVIDEAVQEFLVESNEGLDRFDHDLVQLEKAERDPQLLDSIFRVVHTIKGSGGTLGFRNLLRISHAGENVLSRMRDGSLPLSPPVTSALLAMADALRDILQQIDQDGGERERDYSAVVQQLSELLRDAAPEASASPAAKDQAVEHDPAPAPAVGEILVSSNLCRPEDLRAALELQQTGDPRRVGEILLAQGAVSPGALAGALETQAERHDIAATTLRIDVARLDKVMNLVGELVLARNQVLRLAEAQQDAAWLPTTQRIDAITTELQEAVMKIRMQPIGRLWDKLPRVVRDLAVSCGKQVELACEGAETDLDKTVIEAIKDPLTHIVRNAIDHGIEPPQVRIARGKSPAGHLRLRAFHEAGQVNIEIADDGEGIRTGRLRDTAVAKGLIDAERAATLSSAELLNLIFVPGLSTVEQVSSVSGRGVGMDVVRTNIEKIGGSVEVESSGGRGTQLRIRIPLTLTIIPALMVACAGERFAIPQANVIELIQAGRGPNDRGLEEIRGAMVYRLRGHLLPLLDLSKLLQLSRDVPGQDAVNIVVVQASDRQFGLIVGDISDSQEIVVKPLSRQLKSLACFTGATILGDGRVALILDVAGAAGIAGVFADTCPFACREQLLKPAPHQPKAGSWLLFRLGRDGRSALPVAAVSRLEEIPAAQVERAGGHEIVQYRNQLMPLVRLSAVLGHPPLPATEVLQVIVHASNGHCIGLVVDEILDVVDDEPALAGGSAAGDRQRVAVLRQRVTELIDLPALLHHHGCDWAEAAS